MRNENEQPSNASTGNRTLKMLNETLNVETLSFTGQVDSFDGQCARYDPHEKSKDLPTDHLIVLEDLNMFPRMTAETFNNKQQTGEVTPNCAQSIVTCPRLGYVRPRPYQFLINTRS